MRQLYEDMRNAVQPRTIVIALVAFIIGQLVLNYFVLRPSKELVAASKRKLEAVQDTHLQLKSTDVDNLVAMLKVEIQHLEQKEKDIFSNELSHEQIPLLISRLEQEADGSGLQVSTGFTVGEKKGKNSAETTAIDLKFRGSFEDIMHFLHRLESSHKSLLVKNFNLNSQQSNGEAVAGQLKLVSLIGKK